jgi:hypothetical protein
MMKRIFFTLSFIALSFQSALACDFCNSLLGINPYYNGKNRLSVNFLSQRSFIGAPIAQTANSANNNSAGKINSLPLLMHGGHSARQSEVRETRQTVELAFQYHLYERLMLTAAIPISSLSLRQGSSMSVSGVGDATIFAHFVSQPSWLESFSSLPATWLIGFGVKTPTGLNDLTDANGNRVDTRFQSGSGSWDYLLNTLLSMQNGRFIFTLDALGKLNSANALGDRLGHSFSTTATVAREIGRWNEQGSALIAIVGGRYEAKSQDWIAGRYDSESSFRAIYAQVGAQIAFQFIRLEGFVIVPIHQARAQFAPNEQTRFLTSARVEF